MYNIISLFDGMSCGQIAINHFLKPDDYKWYASEIEQAPMKVTSHNFPGTIQLGDVRFITDEQIKNIGPIFMVMGGSPCTDFSIAGKRKGMSTKENVNVTSLNQYLKLKSEGFEFIGQSYLFWEFVRIVTIAKPKYFLLENVVMKGKNKFWENIINNALDVRPIQINSALVSAQNRDRLYWTNIPNVTTPKDREIMLNDIIWGGYGGYGERGVLNNNPTPGHTWRKKGTVRKDFKANCLTKSASCRYIQLLNGDIQPLSVRQCEFLQTVPRGYTNVPGITDNQKFNMLGNGWTIEVIKHILSFSEELINHSMKKYKTIK